MLYALIANQWRDPESEPVKPEDFLPKRRTKPQEEINRGMVEWILRESQWAERQGRKGRGGMN